MNWVIGCFDLGGYYIDEVYKFIKCFGVMWLFLCKGVS